MAARNDNDGLRVDVIDVGQGESILLEGPTGETMLIDSGDYRDRGEQVFTHLEERGIDSLDHLVATHYDADHIGGHAMIVEEFGPDGIGAIYGPSKEGVNTKESQTKSRYEEAYEASGFEEIELDEGDSIDIEGVAVEVLNPSSEVDSKEQNQNSLVLQASYDEKNVLLTGDVEGEAETRLVEEHADQLSNVDSLKVAHHGSENGTTSKSLTHTEPDSLIISSGLHNRYTSEKNECDAQPHDEMLKRAHDHEDDFGLYWTPAHGTTSARISDEGMQIDTARGQEVLSAADVAALKYYGRANDVDNEKLAEIEEIDPADLPDETPKWACGANIVDTDQTLAEATGNAAIEETAETPMKTSPQSDEELFEAVREYADSQDESVKEVLQSLQRKTSSTESSSEQESSAEETSEPGAEGIRIREELRSLTIENSDGKSMSKDTDKHSDTGMRNSL